MAGRRPADFIGMMDRDPAREFDDPAKYGYSDDEALRLMKAFYMNDQNTSGKYSDVLGKRKKDKEIHEKMMKEARRLAEEARLKRMYGDFSGPAPAPIGPAKTPLFDPLLEEAKVLAGGR